MVVSSQQSLEAVTELPQQGVASPMRWLSLWSCSPWEVEGAWRYPSSSQCLPREEGLCTSPSCPPSTAGWILIDRCGKHFGTILNYLRDGAVPLPESRREIEELLAEAKYYLVQGLVEECQAALQVGITFSFHGGGGLRPTCFPHSPPPCKVGAVPSSLSSCES